MINDDDNEPMVVKIDMLMLKKDAKKMILTKTTMAIAMICTMTH